MTSPSLFQRLKERKLVQWAFAYLAGAWVVVQLLDAVKDPVGLSQVVHRGILAILAVGFLLTLVLAWYHGEKGRQRVSGPELLMVAALLVVAGVALSMLGTGEEVSGPTETEATEPLDDGRTSIAVLPFEDHSPNPEDSWFADGVQDDIDAALRRISALTVKGQSSVDRFREERPLVSEIASILGVDYLVEGNARMVGEQILVNVHLIDGEADEEVWSETYDTLFSIPTATAIQADIAEKVAAEVGARIAPAEQAALATLPTENLDAYRLVHQGRVLWNRRTASDARQAIVLYEEAISLDPGYADAFVGLGEASLYLGIFSPDREEATEGFEQAVTSARQALEIDPTAGGPHAVLGGVELWQRGDFDRAEREFKEAIRLTPDHAFAHYWYALHLSALERHEEAFHQLSIAQRLDLLAEGMVHGPAKLYFQARDYARAVEEGLKAAEVYPEHGATKSWLCQSYLMLRQFDAGGEWCEAEPTGADMALYHAAQGNREAALQEMERAQELSGEQAKALRYQIRATLGDVDEAIGELRHYVDISPRSSMRLRVDAWVDPLRADPRFIQILREIGLER